MNQANFEALAKQIWNRRRVCRPRGIPMSPAWQRIEADATRTLISMLRSLDEVNALSLPLKVEQMDLWLSEAFTEVLNRDRLQSLAIEVQQTEPKTLERQIRMTDLIGAIQLSGHLARPKGLSNAKYADAVNQLFIYIAEKIDNYAAERGDFMKWVNYRLDKMPFEIDRKIQDPMNASLQNLIRRTRGKLKGFAKAIDLDCLQRWIWARVKQCLPKTWDGEMELIYFVFFFRLKVINHKRCWTTLATAILDLPFKGVVSVKEDNEIEMLEQDISSIVSPVDLLRQCLVADETGEYVAKHVRGHPEANFQAIALAHLDGMQWNAMPQYLFELREDAKNSPGPHDEHNREGSKGRQLISVGTLSTFYQRSVNTFRLKLARCISEGLTH